MTRHCITEMYGKELGECPRCETYSVEEYLELHTVHQEEERPDDWRRFLPWNWFGPTETNAYVVEWCRNCRHKVDVREQDIHD